MTVLTGVRDNRSDVWGKSPWADEVNTWTRTFPQVDTFEGVVSDPQSLHKYLYAHADPVNGTDPTGRETLGSLMSGMSVGGQLQAYHSIATAIFGLEVAAGFAAGYYYGVKYAEHLRQARRSWRPPLEDYHDALLAKGAYPNDVSLAASAGSSFVDHFTTPETGFRAVLFSKGGRYVVSFAGTDDPEDWKTNIAQGLYGTGIQYDQAIEAVEYFKSKHGIEIDHFVGHSLGGGLASFAALKYRKPATTFNAAGLHNARLAQVPQQNVADANNLIHAYRIAGEALSTLNDADFTPSSYYSLMSLYRLHPAIDAVLDQIENAPNSLGRTTWLEPASNYLIGPVNSLIWHTSGEVVAAMEKAMSPVPGM